jgi:hypothetical protein
MPSFRAIMNPPPGTHTTSGLVPPEAGARISMLRSAAEPSGRVRRAKTTVLTGSATRVRLIWSAGSGSMTVLVVVSLGAIDEATTIAGPPWGAPDGEVMLSVPSLME